MKLEITEPQFEKGQTSSTEHWSTKPLDEVCEVEYGTRVVQKRDGGKGYPVYGGGGATFEMDVYNREDRLVVARFAMSEQCTRFVAGKFYLNDSGLTVSSKKDHMIQRFLDYQLLAINDDIYALGKGTAQKNLDMPVFRNLPISFPASHAEQRRIVALLDEAFAGIAVAKANAEQNLKNARALFESHLNAIFTNPGPDWVEKHLKEVCEKITDGTHQTPKYFAEGVVFLSSRNVTSGRIDWENIKYIDTKQHLEMHKRVAPRRGDILLAKNGTTGVAAIVDRDTVFDIYVSLAHLRALPVVRPRFLLHFINSPAAKAQFNKRLKGIGVPNLHLEEIREVRIAFPSDLDVQDQVIRTLDEYRDETQCLSRIYERKIAALEELKKSLLHKAFSGEL
jgi:type I restriction enzyme S subunit